MGVRERDATVYLPWHEPTCPERYQVSLTYPSFSGCTCPPGRFQGEALPWQTSEAAPLKGLKLTDRGRMEFARPIPGVKR